MGVPKGYKQSALHVSRRKVWGEDHPQWKGEAASDRAKRCRARARFALGVCATARCGKSAVDRHHKDADTGNNVRSNVKPLCRRCHMVEDGRLEKLKASSVTALPLAVKAAAENRHYPSGVRGASFHKRSGKWVARKQVDGIRRRIGTFTTLKEAAEAIANDK